MGSDQDSVYTCGKLLFIVLDETNLSVLLVSPLYIYIRGKIRDVLSLYLVVLFLGGES